MNRTLKTTLAALAAVAAVYLLCSFVAWDLNPGNWDDADRFIMAGCGFFAAIIVTNEGGME